MISQTAEYALRAIVCLADHPGVPLPTRHIAELTQVPAGYLAKVLQDLGRAELVISQRGLHGGFVLARLPSKMTVLDVIDAIDPLPRIRQCPLELKSHQTALCPLHRRLDEATAMVEKAFRETTIAELLQEQEGSHALCEAGSPDQPS